MRERRGKNKCSKIAAAEDLNNSILCSDWCVVKAKMWKSVRKAHLPWYTAFSPSTCSWLVYILKLCTTTIKRTHSPRSTSLVWAPCWSKALCSSALSRSRLSAYLTNGEECLTSKSPLFNTWANTMLLSRRLRSSLELRSVGGAVPSEFPLFYCWFWVWLE